ncbi:MAG: TrkH family potassium uptake protein [Methyloligellaceae bacterium]
MRAVAVLYILGWLLAAAAVAMLIPAAVAVALDPIAVAQAFVVPALSTGFLGGCLIIAFIGRETLFGRRPSLLLLCGLWVIIPIAGALPLYTAGFPKSLMGAIFEAVSGFTTTGASIFVDLAELPKSIIVWRALLQWTGGLATLLALAAIIAPLTGTELMDRQLRLIGRSAHGSALHMTESLRSILPLYLALTMGCFVCLIFSGLPPFDAFCLSLSTVSTGGFMPRAGTIELYGSPAAELVLAVFMALGGVSIVWIRAILQARWSIVRETREPIWILGLIAVTGVALSAALINVSQESGLVDSLHSITLGLATAASLISTTGLAVSARAHELIPYIALLGLCIIGGGRFSTAGGLKVYRLGVMLRQLGRELRLLVYPHGVRPSRYGDERRDVELLKMVWTVLVAFVLSIGVLAVLLSAAGLPFEASLLAAVTALSNIGPAYEFSRASELANAPSFADMSAWAQAALCGGMILGRVEILALFGLVNLTYWRQ